MGASGGGFEIAGGLNKIIEAERVALQRMLDGEKTLAERRRLGQFATPPELAGQVIDYGLTLLPPGEPIAFLDPAFGTGSFYAALMASAGGPRVALAKGVEVDPHYGGPSRKLWRGAAIDIELADFTALTPEPRYNFVICNPPYVRHQLLTKEQKTRLREKTAQISGVALSGRAGLYCHFLLQSYGWMAEGGIGGWLVPSEFMDVNYGAAIKDFLLDRVELLRVHRFSPKDGQFNDAVVSSAVVWFRKAAPARQRPIVFSYGGSLPGPRVERAIGRGEIGRAHV